MGYLIRAAFDRQWSVFIAFILVLDFGPIVQCLVWAKAQASLKDKGLTWAFFFFFFNVWGVKVSPNKTYFSWNFAVCNRHSDCFFFFFQGRCYIHIALQNYFYMMNPNWSQATHFCPYNKKIEKINGAADWLLHLFYRWHKESLNTLIWSNAFTIWVRVSTILFICFVRQIKAADRELVILWLIVIDSHKGGLKKGYFTHSSIDYWVTDCRQECKIKL